MHNRIVCLVGPSGSGKTTIAKKLADEGYNIILSYTTREKRASGEWGHTFVSEKSYNIDRIINENHFINGEDPHIIAFFEGYEGRYWATKDQYKGKGTSIYIVDSEGAEQVKRNVSDAEVITIFLQCDESMRISRMLKDGRKRNGILDRLMKDKEIFSKCKCDYTVDANRELGQVVGDIEEIIGGA